MHAARRTALTSVLLAALLSGCGSSGSGEGPTASSAATPPASSSAASTSSSAATPATTGGAQSGLPTTGAALAAAVRAASTGMYSVKSVVTGADPATMTARGDLAARTVAVTVAGTPDLPEQKVEMVGGTAYTSLDGVTTGRQRVAVSLTNPDEQLRDAVLPFIAATDLDRVVTALTSATTIAPDPTAPADGATRSVRAVVSARGLAALFGVPLDSAVPASAPVVIGLDDAGRVRTVKATLGTTKRTSTYSGYAPGAAITAPGKADIVENPL